MTREIPLTQNKVALVDDEDYEWLIQRKWLFDGRYASRKSGIKIYMHRLIMSAPKHLTVDHRNGNCLDNRRSNLRLATYSRNSANAKKRQGSSIYKGVTFYKRYSKWRAQICFEYKGISIGYFETEEEAARAYDAKAKELFGEFAYLNFPDQ